MIIAMDGPAGTGKGTICKLISERLDFVYIDTGAMYRAFTLKALRRNVGLDETEKVKDLIKNTKIDLINSTTFNDADNNINAQIKQTILLDGEDVTEEIRTTEVSKMVSQYSAIKELRIQMVEWQRELAYGKDVVMEGRDITTVVFPDADVKIYLTADADERAKRRFKELIEKGIETTFEETKEMIIKRDENDMKKEMGALKIADDAIVVDSTHLTIEDVYEKVKEVILNRKGM